MEDTCDIDTHLCLVCNQTIVGLLNYVMHKKTECPKKRYPQQQPQQTAFNGSSKLYDQPFPLTSTASQQVVVSHHDDILRNNSNSSTCYNLPSQDSLMFPCPPHEYGNKTGSYSRHTGTQLTVNQSYSSAKGSGVNPSSTGLSVDMNSSLSSFIDSSFSPNEDSPVDPSSVLTGSESSKSRPDFFQSLELKSITGRKQSVAEPQGRGARGRRRWLQEEPIDFDLPITMILSNLDFSSDEESCIVNFPSDEDPEEDLSDSEWSSPPKTHTGGKWKPGEGPTKMYHRHQPISGKWKPGQGPHCSAERTKETKSKSQELRSSRPYFCNLCKSTFPDHYTYSGHFTSETHREAVEAQRKGSRSRKDNVSVSLEGSASEATVLSSQQLAGSNSESKLDNASFATSSSNSCKKRNYSGPFCETCDLYFDCVKVYEIHCDTKKHKEMTEKNKQKRGAACVKVPQEDCGVEDLSNTPVLDSKTVENQELNEKDTKGVVETHYCVICKKTFARKYEMARHLLTHFHKQRAMKHPQALEMLDKYNKYVIRLCPFQCNVCQFYFNRASDLLDHLMTKDHEHSCEDLVGPLLCVTCKYKTHSPDEILVHVQSRQHHALVARNHHVCIIRECHSKITCKFCGVQMHSAVRMKRHIDYRHKDRRVQEPLEIRATTNRQTCPDCNKMYRSKSALQKHYRQRHQKCKPYRCDVCNKGFSEMRGLMMHDRTSLHERRVKARQKQDGANHATEDSDVDTDPEKQPSRKQSAPLVDRSKADGSAGGRVTKRKRGRPRKFRLVEGESDDENFVSDTIKVLLRAHKKEDGKGNTQSKEKSVLSKPSKGFSNSVSTDIENDVTHFEGIENDESLSLNENITSEHVKHDELSEIDRGSCAETPHSQEESTEDCGNQTSHDYGLKSGERVRPKGSARPAKSADIFRCEHCQDFCGDTMEDLRTHYTQEHPSHIIHCDPCTQFFLSKKAYKIHCAGGTHQARLSKLVAADNKLELHVCPHCNKKYNDEKSFQLHVEFKHLHISTEEDVTRLCQGRDMVTQLYGEHLRQLEKVSHDSTVSCPECGKFFVKTNLIEHLRTHTGERPYQCRHCSSNFGSRMSLRRHLIEHIGNGVHKCETCGREFKKQNAFYFHQRLHQSEKKGLKFDCDVCGASFLLQSQLVNHKKRHGDRKFKCAVPGCFWHFVLKTELDQHMLTHTQEKSFLCDVCGSGFSNKTRLKRHVKTHQGSREIPCEYCPYKAGCKTHLRRHMRIHIGSKPFKCLYCSYACNTHENIRKHILKTRKHQGLKIYPCKFCSFQSNEGKDFKKHLMLEHMEYLKARPSESLVKFTGLYHPEEDIAQPPEGGEIHQVMKGRFVKTYDSSRHISTSSDVNSSKKKSTGSGKRRNRCSQAIQQSVVMHDQKLPRTDEPTTALAQEVIMPEGSALSLVTQHQPAAMSTVQQVDVAVLYPQALPWTVVSRDNWLTAGGHEMDVVGQPTQVQTYGPEGVQVLGSHVTGTTYLSSAQGGAGILTVVNVDDQTFQQMEAGSFQVIPTNVSISH